MEAHTLCFHLFQTKALTRLGPTKFDGLQPSYTKLDSAFSSFVGKGAIIK